MSSARALLKAKRQEARVSHPLASYNASGQLRCVACGTAVKYASAWDGHVGSKAHRMNVARMKEEERLKEEQRLRDEEERTRGKRKAPGDEGGDVKKRRLSEDEDEVPLPASNNGFPVDFFSDPSRAPALGGDDGDADDVAKPAAQRSDVIDLEWEQFQQTVLSAPDPQSDLRDRFEQATIFAEPEPASEVPEGFPALAGQSESAEVGTAGRMDEETLRKRKETDDRELIMDRLMDEELAQEEADAKVIALKSRLDMAKKKREAAKAAQLKTGKKSS